MANNLLPCPLPLCGGEPHDRGYGIECRRCGLWLGDGTRCRAVSPTVAELWNSRPELTEAREALNNATAGRYAQWELDRAELETRATWAELRLAEAREAIRDYLLHVGTHGGEFGDCNCRVCDDAIAKLARLRKVVE